MYAPLCQENQRAVATRSSTTLHLPQLISTNPFIPINRFNPTNSQIYLHDSNLHVQQVHYISKTGVRSGIDIDKWWTFVKSLNCE